MPIRKKDVDKAMTLVSVDMSFLVNEKFSDELKTAAEAIIDDIAVVLERRTKVALEDFWVQVTE